jgi:hypothetical protein
MSVRPLTTAIEGSDGRGQRLENRRFRAVAGDGEIGECAADVDADLKRHGLCSVFA